MKHQLDLPESLTWLQSPDIPHERLWDIDSTPGSPQSEFPKQTLALLDSLKETPKYITIYETEKQISKSEGNFESQQETIDT